MAGKKERNTTVDIVKAILILGIAFYHLVYRKQNGIIDFGIQALVYLAIPLFFFLSGYFYRHDSKWFDPMIKRIRRVSIPEALFVTGSLIILAPYFWLVHGYTLHQWASDVITTFLRPEFTAMILPDYSNVGTLFNNLSMIWYIWTLVFATMLLYVVAHFTGETDWKIITASMILIAVGAVLYVNLPALSWSLTNVPVYTGIMLLGFLMSKYKVIDKITKIKLVPAVLIMIVTAVLHLLIYKYIGYDQTYRSVYSHTIDYPATFFFVIQTFIGGYSILTFARLISLVKPAEKALSWVGRHTSVILVTHCIIGGIAADIMQTYNKPGPNWYVDPLTAETVIKSIISFIVAIAGSIGIALMNDKIKSKTQK